MDSIPKFRLIYGCKTCEHVWTSTSDSIHAGMNCPRCLSCVYPQRWVRVIFLHTFLSITEFIIILKFRLKLVLAIDIDGFETTFAV